MWLNHSKLNTKKPRIAIAGATGRVGAALTALLAADRIELVALTRESSTARLPEGLAAFKVDLKGRIRLRRLCAALIGYSSRIVPRSIKFPTKSR